MNSKNTGKSRNRRFQPIGLIFYCYLLIPLNELAIMSMIINKLKILKKIIDISMVSIEIAGKGVFGLLVPVCESQTREKEVRSKI